MKITKKKAKTLLGISSDAELARRLGVTRQALTQWRDKQSIPKKRVQQVKAMLGVANVV